MTRNRDVVTFTFQYVSINTTRTDKKIRFFLAFTFQYVSINTT